MTDTPRRPVNQTIRIAILRLAFVALVPLMLFTRSAWGGVALIHDILVLAGTFAVIAAVLGRFWAILYIGGRKNRVVMQDGPYSICRHPLYLFSSIGAVGLGLLLGSALLAVIIGGVTFAILTITARKEEGYLIATFGQDYLDYAARVPRILPKIALFRTEPEVTFSVGILRQNFADALVFLGFLPLAMFLPCIQSWLNVPTLPLP